MIIKVVISQVDHPCKCIIKVFAHSCSIRMKMLDCNDENVRCCMSSAIETGTLVLVERAEKDC